MEEYGYTWNEMLPLTQGRALELFDRDLPVCLLHEDGSEIGVNIHTPGTEAFEDVGIDILTGNRIDLDILEYIPDIKGNPQAMEVIAELVAKLPEMEIDGRMSEEFEAKVWEKRMPDLTPAEQLAVEIDRFMYDYDTA